MDCHDFDKSKSRNDKAGDSQAEVFYPAGISSRDFTKWQEQSSCAGCQGGGEGNKQENQNSKIFDEVCGLQEKAQGSLLDINDRRAFSQLPQNSQKAEFSKPNFLIKGNNLLVLHSLKHRKDIFGQVKLIYIDPPYNTGNDSFNYNDNFNHCSWLTFMKNRLEIAKDFLRDDGVIFVQCDDNEQAYLKVLMDEIFGRENFVACFVAIMKPAGRQESAYPIAKSHEYILSYSKKETYATFYNLGAGFDSNREDEFRLTLLRKTGSGSTRADRPKMFYPIYFNTKTQEIYLEKTNLVDEIEILPIKTDGSEGRWRWQKSNVENNINLLVCKKNMQGNYEIYTKDYIVKDGNIKGNKSNTFIVDKDIINSKAKSHLGEILGNKEIFSYPKSEFLLQRIIELSTQENDLIMDFFAGSGTTLAVAHKMNRRYVGIEQMDYIESITKERLKKVINGEQGGISKAVNFTGGGEFIYCELMPLNAVYKEKILNLVEHSASGNHLQDCENFEAVICDQQTPAPKSPQNLQSTTANPRMQNFEAMQLANLTQDTRITDSQSVESENSSLRGEAEAIHKINNENMDCHEANASRNDNETCHTERSEVSQDSIDKKLNEIYEELQTKAFIDYRIDIKELLGDLEFHALDLAQKQKVLLQILDSNMDYMLLGDLEDKDLNLSEEIIALNKAFYGIKDSNE